MSKNEGPKKPLSLKKIESISEDYSDFKKAIDYYIKDCNNKIAKLQHSNFYKFEQLSNIMIDITSLQAQVYDGEVFLNQKDSDNPRDLRDSIEKISNQKAQIALDIQLAKDNILKLEKQATQLQEEIKNNDIQSLKINKRIEAAKELLKKKKEENK